MSAENSFEHQPPEELEKLFAETKPLPADWDTLNDRERNLLMQMEAHEYQCSRVINTCPVVPIPEWKEPKPELAKLRFVSSFMWMQMSHDSEMESLAWQLLEDDNYSARITRDQFDYAFQKALAHIEAEYVLDSFEPER